MGNGCPEVKFTRCEITQIDLIDLILWKSQVFHIYMYAHFLEDYKNKHQTFYKIVRWQK